MSNFIDKIKQDITQSGFLSELSVAQILKSREWKLSFGQSYQDYDENKSREIDIAACKVYNDVDIKFQLVVNLCIEVKKEPSYPWVVFMTESQWRSYGWSIQHCGESYHADRGTIFSKNDLDMRLLTRADKKMGTSFYEAFKKTEAPSKIFKALIGASKAAYFNREIWGECADNVKYDPKGCVVVEFMIPLVVVEGQLFEVQLSNHDLDVHPSDWIPVKFNYSSPYYAIKSSHGVTFYPFISKVESLSILLDVIEQWSSLVFGNFQESVRKKREVADR